MTKETELDYHLERAKAERVLAARGACEASIRSHIGIAELHESRAEELTVLPWEESGSPVLREVD